MRYLTIGPTQSIPLSPWRVGRPGAAYLLGKTVIDFRAVDGALVSQCPETAVDAPEILDDRSSLLQVIVREIVRVCQIIPIRLVVVAPITDLCPGRAQKLVDPVIVLPNVHEFVDKGALLIVLGDARPAEVWAPDRGRQIGDILGSNGIGFAADIPVIGGNLQFWVGKGFFKHLAQETSFSVSDFSTRHVWSSAAVWTALPCRRHRRSRSHDKCRHPAVGSRPDRRPLPHLLTSGGQGQVADAARACLWG
jgi:hypothetical protein